MSYRRWSDGNWYAFNHVSEAESKEEEVLSLWHAPSGIDGGVKDWLYEEVAKWTSDDVRREYPEASDDDVQEAMEIIEEFVEHMNEEYSNDE